MVRLVQLKVKQRTTILLNQWYIYVIEVLNFQ